MSTIVASIAVVLIVGWAVYYLYAHRKSGKACIGCALDASCPVKGTRANNEKQNRGLVAVEIVKKSELKKRSNGGGCCGG